MERIYVLVGIDCYETVSYNDCHAKYFIEITLEFMSMKEFGGAPKLFVSSNAILSMQFYVIKPDKFML